MNNPAPPSLVASDGRPSTLSDCAGRAKMRVRQTRAGREPEGSIAKAKQSQAVTHSVPSRSLPSQALDEAGPEAARILLRDNLRAFFPRSGSRILPQPVDARQSLPSRCANLKDLPTSAFFAIVNAYSAAAEAGERAYLAERELANARNSKVAGLAVALAGPQDERVVK